MFSKEITEIISTTDSSIGFLHSTNLVDPISHACTNRAEGRWKHVKRKLSAVNGSSAELLSRRERYGKNGPTAFENILSHIAEIYSKDRENQPNLYFFFPILYNNTLLELP